MHFIPHLSSRPCSLAVDPLGDLLAGKLKAELRLLINIESIKWQAGLSLSTVIPVYAFACHLGDQTDWM